MQNRDKFVVDKFVVDEFRNLIKKIYDERFKGKVRQTTNNRKLPMGQYANFSKLNPELRLIFKNLRKLHQAVFTYKSINVRAKINFIGHFGQHFSFWRA